MNFTPQSAIQRIQVGLIGLVAVLLFVSITNLIVDRSAADIRNSRQALDKTGAKIEAVSQSRDEPLAELGVAPTVADQPAVAKNSPGSPQ